LRLFDDERPLKFAALPKTLPLWAYLLLNRAEPVPRDSLAYALWPNVPESKARANLRRHLYELRRALPPHPQDVPWLLRQADTLQWNPAVEFWLDVAEFERLSASPHHLAKAAALYGDDLLPNVYEDWISFDRERLRNQYLFNLSQLICQSRARGDYSQAVVYAQKILSLDPLREDAVRELISLHYGGGDRAGALRVYRHFARRLQEELGVTPMPETEALFDALLRDKPLPGSRPRTAIPVAPSHNLPAQLNAFFGRTRDLTKIGELQRGDLRARLLTLTGPAGTGKTRLSLEVGARLLSDQASTFPDGIFFVDLSPINERDLVISAIADVLGVTERRDQSLLESLKDWLRSKYLLLLLDNFEQVIEAGSLVVELLAAAPGLRVLVTSRIVLQVYGEHEYPVLPLPLPDLKRLPPTADLMGNAAVSLFVARARERQPNFALTDENAAVVAEICVRLDGLPLAIELSASRIKMFPPVAMLTHLTNRLAFVVGGTRDRPERHQTLRRTIEWSYSLLGRDEKMVLARLAVFKSGFTHKAAQAVTSLPAGQREGKAEGALSPPNTPLGAILASLVDQSMLQVAQSKIDEMSRFWMLLTLQEYALEKLAARGELTQAHRAHARHYLSWAEEAERALKGPEQLAWLERLEAEHDNLRAVLEWAIAGQGERASLGLKLAGALGLFWSVRGHWMEGYRWLKEALDNNCDAPAPARAKALLAAGTLLHFRWRFEQAAPLLHKSLALYQELDEKEGMADALYWLGRQAFRQKDYQGAAGLIEQSLALYQEANHQYGVSMAFRNLGDCARLLKDYERAHWLYEQGLALARKIGNKQGIAYTLNSLGELARLQGNFVAAELFYEEDLGLVRELGNRFSQAVALHNLGHTTLRLGDLGRAAALFEESLSLYQRLEYTRGVALCLAGLAGVANSAGQAVRATSLLGKASAALQASNVPLPLGPADRAAYDRHLAAAKTQLDPRTFAAAWEAGQQMTLVEAVVYALEQSP
jgi:predicted ATPase/DNA-binding SARP family transcriptional activator